MKRIFDIWLNAPKKWTIAEINLLRNIFVSIYPHFTFYSGLHFFQWQILLCGMRCTPNYGKYLTLWSLKCGSVNVGQITGSSCLLSDHWSDITGPGRGVMDPAALTLSVLVKQINRSSSSRDGFYTFHQRLSIGLTSVQSDYNSNSPDIHLTHPILYHAWSKLTRCCSETYLESVSVFQQFEDLSQTLGICHFYTCCLMSFSSLYENETTSLENIMWYFIDPCKFSLSTDLLAAGSDTPGTGSDSASCSRAKQQIVTGMRAWTFTVWPQDGLPSFHDQAQ